MFLKKKIIKHYANIFYDYSIKNVNNVIHDTFYHKIKIVCCLLNNNEFFIKISNNSLLDSKNKIKIFRTNFYNFDHLIYRFIEILTLHKREYLFYQILLEYQKIYERKIKKLIKCSITTVFPISIDMQEKIAYKIYPLKKDKHYYIVNKINKSIIGGFIFCIEDNNKEWDFSIKKQLSYIQEKIFNS
ncbi:F0F1 ATP synthase subunit delta [Blattabacterium cuenoti]|uniref:F0F1 ATP synthase subunit delta n=1 Tax=Blattabacterium cuenoti TaxID=1653831 RepID=UPI00163C3090|nr:F0F1 ATP synthase subunit delta [Blattabacterium cuenoti]